MNPDQKFFYVAVLAEVLHSTDNGKTIQGQKIQFFSKNMNPTFPLNRMRGLQQSAAQTLRENHPFPLGEVCGVWLHNIIPLGEMTDAEFENEGITLGLPSESTPEPITDTQPRLRIVPDELKN